MTNPIEQEFYKEFDIEPKRKRDSETHLMYTVYPPITNDTLLELEDIVLKQSTHIEYDYFGKAYWCKCEIPLTTSSGETRKEAFLNVLVNIAEDYKSGNYHDGEDIIYHTVCKIMGVETKGD